MAQNVTLISMIPALKVRANDAETATQVLKVREQSASGATASKPREVALHNVVRGDSLSKISDQFYGKMHKWPIIYEANPTVIGTDPNAITPGQVLRLPPLPAVNLVSPDNVLRGGQPADLVS